ncbi:hypothetical protein ScPMuIL_011209 [Solemya velum]
MLTSLSSTEMGVHLEEPSSPLSKQWNENLDGFVKQLANPNLSLNRFQPVNMLQSERLCQRDAEKQMKDLSRDMQNKCTTNCVLDKCNDKYKYTDIKQNKRSGHRIAKGKSKEHQHFSEVDDGIELSVSSVCDDYVGENARHNLSPTPDSSKVVFDCDSTPENSDENSHKSPDREMLQFHTKKEKDSKRRRFRRMITRPLRRSHSAGCEKDIPAHALFLQYNAKDRNMDSMESRALELSGGSQSPEGEDEPTPLRRAVHKTCSADAAMMAAEDLPGSHTVHPKSKSRNLARNMKKKLQFLRRRNTDSALGAALMKTESKLSPEQAQQWSRCFESLLTDKNGLELFRGFLRSEFSEENIEFWIACEDLKTCKANKVTAKAHKIYSDFVAVQAPKEINLDSKTRIQAISSLVNPSRDVFDKAQKRIQGLMEKDSYPRFLQSDIYLQLISKEET